MPGATQDLSGKRIPTGAIPEDLYERYLRVRRADQSVVEDVRLQMAAIDAQGVADDARVVMNRLGVVRTEESLDHDRAFALRTERVVASAQFTAQAIRSRSNGPCSTRSPIT